MLVKFKNKAKKRKYFVSRTRAGQYQWQHDIFFFFGKCIGLPIFIMETWL